MSKLQSNESMVSLPRYRVDAQEWAATPRSIPDRVLRWASILPYYALIGFFLATERSIFRVETEVDIFLVMGLIFWGLFSFLAVRVAPWTCLLGVLALMFFGDHSPLSSTLVTVIALWLVALGIVASVSGIRLTLQIRSWRQRSHGHVLVSKSLLKGTSMQRSTLKRISQAGITIAILLLAKAVVSFFKGAQMSLNALPSSATAKDLDMLAIPIIAVIFWIVVWLTQVLQEKIAGEVVLDIPVDPTTGPLLFGRAMNAVEYAQTQLPGCTCGAKEREQKDHAYAVLPLDDDCPVHGIEAINALSAIEFQRVAQQPWVWGENANALPVKRGERIEIIGLHGWGSSPRLLGTAIHEKAPNRPTHTGYSPWRAREMNKREARIIRWRDVIDSDPNWLSAEEKDSPVIDHIRLDSIGLPGYAVRTEGKHPRFETHPPSLALSKASG